jgi:hypothetical protein
VLESLRDRIARSERKLVITIASGTGSFARHCESQRHLKCFTVADELSGGTVFFGFFDVSSGSEQVSQGRGDHIDHGGEGCDVAISASTGPGGLEQAVEPFETGIAV